MTDLTRRLYEHTDAFLPDLRDKPLSIVVDGDPDGLANIPGSLRRIDGSESGTIRGLDRVAWVALTDDGNRITANISTNYDPDADTEPCYWLPWKQNATVRIKVKPSKKVTDDVAFAVHQFNHRAEHTVHHHAAQRRNMLKDLPAERREPRLFFTAMLTGCSVHIEGDPQAPNVFHGNASRIGATPSFWNLANFNSVLAHDDRLLQVEEHLLNEYQGMRTVGAPNVAHLGAHGYQFRVWGNEYVAETLNYGRDFIPGGGDGARVLVMKAAVFGVRIAGQWRFYAQRIYRYRVDILPQQQIGTMPVQIWPGAGQINI